MIIPSFTDVKWVFKILVCSTYKKHGLVTGAQLIGEFSRNLVICSSIHSQERSEPENFFDIKIYFLLLDF